VVERDLIEAIGSGIATYCLCAFVSVLIGRPPFDPLDALLMIAAFSAGAFWGNRNFRSAL
jgi:hypothetical protein